MDKDTPFGSDIKSLHQLLDLEKYKSGRKVKEEEEEEEEEKEEEEEEKEEKEEEEEKEKKKKKKKKKKKGPAPIKFTDCTSVIFLGSLIGG
jgi:negative regulator of genetic competence, sporulation and motility